MARSTIALALLGLLACAAVTQAADADTQKHGRKHGKGDYRHDDDDCPKTKKSAKSCVCQVESLPATPLSTQNGCDTTGAACTVANIVGGSATFCSGSGAGSGEIAGVCGSSCFDNLATGATYAFCASPAGQLCYEVACPRNGTINIKADAVPLTCCSISDFLYIYKDAPLVGNAVQGGDNVLNADITATCAAGDKFYICEKAGIITSSSLKATFTTQTKNGDCTTLPAMQGAEYKQLSCNKA